MNKILMWILIALGAIVLVSAGVVVYELGAGGGMIKKPALYLYPEQDSFINVKLDVNGIITTSIPEYHNNWYVYVTKQGLIENRYDYLFYEADLKKIKLPKESWVVKYAELEPWFDTNLAELGLNPKELSQFKEYWLIELPESEYYEIKLLEKEFLEQNMNLIINPKPNTLIRLNFYFKPLKKEKNTEEPLIETPNREGFTVVEWGGILAK